MAAVCGDRLDLRCLGRILAAKLDAELEEAKLVRGIRGADDEGAYVSNVDVATGNCQSYHTLAVVVIP